MSILNFIKFILELKNVEIVEQISIYLGTRQIIKINLNEMNIKSWSFDHDSSELNIHFYNKEIENVPKIIQIQFEIFRLTIKEHQIQMIRLEKSKIHDFCHLMIQDRKDLNHYLKLFIPLNQIERIKEYVKDNNLTSQVNMDKFD